MRKGEEKQDDNLLAQCKRPQKRSLKLQLGRPVSWLGYMGWLGYRYNLHGHWAVTEGGGVAGVGAVAGMVGCVLREKNWLAIAWQYYRIAAHGNRSNCST